MSGPLKNVRVLDMSRILAGPFATQLLGDLGADVIKFERPGAGDDTRSWGPPFHGGNENAAQGLSAYYLSTNRNKRSVALDISDPEDRRAILDIARECDVFVENFKVGGLKKYGLDYESVRQVRPDVVYCSISGYGQTGPNASKPGYDLMAQAYSGIMAITGDPEGEPMKVGVGIADVMCGMYASVAILAALKHRDETGEGQHIDLGLVDSTVSWLVNNGVNYLTDGTCQRFGNQHPNIVPYQVFEVADGHIVLAVGNDRQFSGFCGIISRSDLAADRRFATNSGRVKNRAELVEIISKCLSNRHKDEVISALEAAGVPGGPVNTVPEIFASQQVADRDMKISMPHPAGRPENIELIGNPIRFSKTPVSYRRAPPTCGQDTQEVLAQFRKLEQT